VIFYDMAIKQCMLYWPDSVKLHLGDKETKRQTQKTHWTFDLEAKQPHAAQVCHLTVSTLIIHVTTWITTHLPTPKWWKA